LIIKEPYNTVGYYIVSGSQNSELFFATPSTGQIYLRTNIVGTSINQYNVRFLFNDFIFFLKEE
jgi:hypothetical protein